MRRIMWATAIFGAISAYGTPITTGSLISEMVDLRGLTMFPDPAYKTVQFSSYDHRSVLPGGPEWFANSDGFGSEPIPNFEAVVKEPGSDKIGEYLICDVEGPGAVVRTWSARMLGNIRVHLDGAETPVFDGPSEDFLMRTYAAYAPAAGLGDEVFAGRFYQRNAAYCPMPFAKRCRIVWIGNLTDTHFYQVQVRLYDKDAQVVTFSPEDLKMYAADLQRVSGVLADPDGARTYASSATPIAFSAKIVSGARETAFELQGPKAIERLSVRVKAQDLVKALRQTLLIVACDDYPWGQVQSPVGDFFGAAPGVNPFVSVPFTVAPDGTMTCRYVMPCARNVKVLFENRGEQKVEVSGEALPMDYAWDDARSMHFRARWRVDHDLVSSSSEVQDMPFLMAQGAGVYVGTALMLLNPNNVPWSGGNWWGEGDEKVFVDDDVRPSTFGTGSEDYFDYAWSAVDIFGFPYCGQPRNDGPANRGFVTNQRWHVIDALPFSNRIAFYIELFCHEPTKGYSYARIAYHYGRPGLIDDFVTITDEDLRAPQLPSNWEPLARAGAANSKFYAAEDLLNRNKHVKIEEDALWTGGRLCRWTPDAVGDELVLEIPIAKRGKYVLRLGMAQDATSGKVSAKLDGAPCGFGGEAGIVDCYVPYRTLLRNVEAGTLELDEGKHRLTLRFEGGAPDIEKPNIGLDYVWVQQR